MSKFNNLEAGSKLMIQGRRLGCSMYRLERFNMIEWLEIEVEKVTPKFYIVGGEKYRKDVDVKHFTRRHYMPGEDGAPLESNSAEFDKFLDLHRKLDGVNPMDMNKLEQLPSLELAASFAVRIKDLYAEIDAEIAKNNA